MNPTLEKGKSHPALVNESGSRPLSGIKEREEGKLGCIRLRGENGRAINGLTPLTISRLVDSDRGDRGLGSRVVAFFAKTDDLLCVACYSTVFRRCGPPTNGNIPVHIFRTDRGAGKAESQLCSLLSTLFPLDGRRGRPQTAHMYCTVYQGRASSSSFYGIYRNCAKKY